MVESRAQIGWSRAGGQVEYAGPVGRVASEHGMGGEGLSHTGGTGQAEHRTLGEAVLNGAANVEESGGAQPLKTWRIQEVR
ncbi:hypothetical protein ABZ622_38710 [Streptomyces sp. NPDC007164]|uniref:hypothetical protein n=1 Tax=Streptomyces sp. NPDC007164 TaxID=3156918 RepID=UPI0033DA5B86